MAASRSDDPLDLAFRALADPSRRALLDSLNDRDGQTLGELCAQLEMARQSVSKHLAVLEEANLLTTVRRGREKLHYLNAEPINAISERWIDHYDRRRVRALADLKRALEETPMERPEFVYTTYIKTTPELVWKAITDPAFCREYLALESDWEVGSTYVWDQDGLKIAHPDQVVLESDPYRRLAFTFHTFVPELAEVTRLEEETIVAAAGEPRSKVTFEIEPRGDQVKLTVIHDGFEPGSTVLGLIGDGWPIKLSILKTLLEREGTGDAVPTAAT
ncbi:MAG TPA: metalloregulator ArsR/SmtB family transcription factor [Solirubrobacterales bacterium]|nr:metalloregulator ArsR/SmtB family transcription factor [Solirubrobacterales bacterium]